MTDPFDGPGSTTGVDYNEINGRLLLITPNELVKDLETSVGTDTAVRGDVVVLDGPGAPVEIRDTLIFPKVLQGQVRANAGTGRMNLGRLCKGESKNGKSAPWMLSEPTDADKAIARRHLAAGTKPPF
jgi:hypothetical protein